MARGSTVRAHAKVGRPAKATDQAADDAGAGAGVQALGQTAPAEMAGEKGHNKNGAGPQDCVEMD